MQSWSRTMTADLVPSPRERYVVEDIDNESLIYRQAAKSAVYLNETATVIWKLCDGTRSAREIAAVLAEAYPEEAETIAADVAATIDELINVGALKLAERRPGVEGHAVKLEP
jgi:hypothetical protein